MRKNDLTKVLKKTMLNVDYMLDVAIQEIGNVNLLKKEWVENIKDNTERRKKKILNCIER